MIFLPTIINFLFLTKTAIANTANYVPLVEIPLVAPEGGTDLQVYVENGVVLLISVAAILAIIFITIGGVKYLSTDSWSGKSEGKEMVWNALLGLLLAISAYAILYTINPDILNLNLNRVPPPTSTLNTQPTSTKTTPSSAVEKKFQALGEPKSVNDKYYIEYRAIGTNTLELRPFYTLKACEDYALSLKKVGHTIIVNCGKISK